MRTDAHSGSLFRGGVAEMRARELGAHVEFEPKGVHSNAAAVETPALLARKRETRA